MWEWHAEEYDVIPMENKYLYVGELRARKPYAIPKPQKSLEEVIEEIETTGRNFTYRELREHFGFTIAMAKRFVTRKGQTEDGVSREEKLLEREKRIIEMRLTPGTTLKDIAEKEGITRERIRQILLAAEKLHGIQLPHGREPKPLVLIIAVRCFVCLKPKEVRENEKDIWSNKFCKEHYMGKYGLNAWQTTGFKWWAENDKSRARWRYHNDVTKREVSRNATLEWIKKVKKDPIKFARYRQKQNEAAARYEQRKKAEKEKNKPKPRPFIEVQNNDTEIF